MTSSGDSLKQPEEAPLELQARGLGSPCHQKFLILKSVVYDR